MKKILSLVLVLLMVFSVVPAVFADTATTAAEESAYQDALDFLKALGFYKGGADVNDDDAITRWQMALFAARFQTGFVEDSYWATTENDVGFPDIVGLEAYQIGAINFAAQQGIVNGFEDGNFRPNDGIQYRDALVMVVRALGTQYAASGYPWSYIKTAREMGLTDGIENIGWTTEITREVVAQILYNAFFVEVEGETVAESVFNVGEATVMITATNNYKYSADYSTVLATNYVQFQVVNEQGEPAGVPYHVPAANFGLSSKAEQTAAIGDVFAVTYKNNYNQVLSAKNLTTDYENNGINDLEIAISSDGYGYYLNLAGQKTKLVPNYTNLFNADRADTTPAGTAEAKLYLADSVISKEVGTQVIGKTYALYPDGWIYKIADLTPVGFYSEMLNTWYTYSVDSLTNEGTFTKVDTSNAMVQDLMSKAYGLRLVTNTDISAYAKVTAADINADGIYDSAVLKNYKFGQYVNNVGTSSDKVLAGFNIRTFGTLDATGTLSAWYATSVDTTKTGATADYTVVSMAPTAKAAQDGDYIIYYHDPINNIVDIAYVVPAKTSDNQTSYVTTGYVLGYFQSSNVIFLDDGDGRNETIKIGYNTLDGRSYYAFGSDLNSDNSAVAENNALIADLSNYVTAQKRVDVVVIDGNLVYMGENTASTSDIVYIESFAAIDATGIWAKAYSTVEDNTTAKLIKIAEYEGWDLNGFDWQAYLNEVMFDRWLKGETGALDTNKLLAQLIPVTADKFYKVISVNGSDYNLGEIASSEVTKDQILKTVSGFLYKKDVASSGAFTHSNLFTYTNAADYWMIRIEADTVKNTPAEIICVPGKIVDFQISGVDLWKFNKNDYDYVISGTREELKPLLDAIVVDNSERVYVALDTTPNYRDFNTKWDYTANGYFVQLQMTNVVNAQPVLVRFTGDTIEEVEAVLNAVTVAGASALDTIYVANVNNSNVELAFAGEYDVDGKIDTTKPVVTTTTFADVVAGLKKTTDVALYNTDYAYDGTTKLAAANVQWLVDALYNLAAGADLPGNAWNYGSCNSVIFAYYSTTLNEYRYATRGTDFAGANGNTFCNGKGITVFYNNQADITSSAIVYIYDLPTP